MKRAGFTMIELIFVIVILGILAAVAIPKLAATRDDAKITGNIASAITASKNLAAEWTAQGTWNNYSPAAASGEADCITFADAVSGTVDGNVSATPVNTTACGGSAAVREAIFSQLITSGLVDGNETNPTVKYHNYGGVSVVR